MKALGPPKELLLMEAEVCRRLLAADWEATRAGVLAGVMQAKSFSFLASLAGMGWATVNLLRKRKASQEQERGARFGLVFHGLKFAAMAWPVLKVIRARERAMRFPAPDIQ